MAEIYRATLDTSQGTLKELVIKRVLPHLAKNRDFIEMFIDEARITMPLNHGNIVQVFEFGQVGSDHFLAMEFVRGRNLETVLSRVKELGEKVPIPLALFVASEVAKGLDYAHRFRDLQDRPIGIIHRDVSPQNILIGFQGEVKLTDFGIAKARSRIRETAQGIIRGKACYLSPEQANCTELDGRSDLFSLGVLLYEVLTGLRPFEGDTEIRTLQMIRQHEVRSPSKLRPDIPAEVDRAVLQALSKDRTRRFQTAGAFQTLLSRSLMASAPEFTPAILTDWMRKLFEEEIQREVAAHSTRERMIERLAREQTNLDGSQLTTAELLKLGTVSIQKGKAPVRRFRRIWWMALSLLSLLGASLGAWALWPPRHGAGTNGGGLPPDEGATPLMDGGVTAKNEIPEAQEESSSEEGGDPQLPDDDSEAPAATNADSAQLPSIRFGFLNLNSSPWAFVEIDGKQLPRETPLFGVRVREGRHRLRFFNPKLNIEKMIPVWVVPNRTETITVRLTEP